MKKENNIYDKSFAFAVRSIAAYKYLVKQKREYTLSRQLLRSATSIGANVAEANGAVSRKDFSNKMSIAYKECLETKYWLDLLRASGYIENSAYESIFRDADELGRILYAIIKKTRS